MSETSNSQIQLSIIIPAYNEELRLPRLLEELVGFFLQHSWIYEIIVVDDGSRDKTAHFVQEFQRKAGQVKLIQFLRNKGKGAAVKAGFLQAAGTVVLFMDADGSTALDEIWKKMPYFDQGYDVIIGSRVIKDSQYVVQAKWHRKSIGAVFNFFVQTLLFKDFKDTQC